MINLLDPSALPDSRSAGPETWMEAVTTLAGARDAADTIIENSLSDRDLLEDIYKQRIDRIESLTGEELENPIRSYAFSVVPVPGFLQPTEREAYRQYEDEFEQKVQSLSERYPQLSGALSLGEQRDVTGPFSGTVEAERLRRIHDADRRAQEASASPALGIGGRLAGEMLGGLRAAARDPLQWQMAVTAGGGTMAKTVAGRIGQTVMQEALLNGGQELVLQGLSQERKREAGLEHGMNEMLANAGIAATFGAIFGGTLQGGAEIARVFKLGEGGAERAARVLDGRPEPGDVEAVAAAMGAQLDPLQLGMLTRSFEDRVLDDVALRPDASPNEMRVYEAAQRYAEDPDNNPPPELLERMLAEEDALRTRFSPDEYERMFAGDPNAIDDIGDTFFADTIDDAARQIDAVSARVDGMEAAAQDARARGDGDSRPAGASDGSARGDRNASQNDLPASDPIEGQTIRPPEPAEPLDDAAFVAAEKQAGEIVEPPRDANGNPERYLDFVGVEDGDGNVKIMSTAEALAMADEPDFFADLMEACKL